MAGARDVPLPQINQNDFGANLASYWTGTVVLLCGVKWSDRQLDHSRPSIAEVKNEWTYTSTPPVCLYGEDSGNFIFLYVNVIDMWQDCLT
jgi:hypothetical protein